MAASLILMAAPLILASAPPPDTPSDTVSDQHRYYTLTVSQNNEHKSFDDNFIDMESAEVKSGNQTIILYTFHSWHHDVLNPWPLLSLSPLLAYHPEIECFLPV